VETAVQALTTASHKLAEEMYKKASEAGAGAGAQAGSDGHGDGAAKTDEKVVDAEFEEVDKDKK
ncbi:MAG: hypothetical protein FJ246_10830, partial [Nitrospira sp.]|nr:hypothetical protein [Nitrospira sp.]